MIYDYKEKSFDSGKYKMFYFNNLLIKKEISKICGNGFSAVLKTSSKIFHEIQYALSERALND